MFRAYNISPYPEWGHLYGPRHPTNRVGNVLRIVLFFIFLSLEQSQGLQYLRLTDVGDGAPNLTPASRPHFPFFRGPRRALDEHVKKGSTYAAAAELCTLTKTNDKYDW